MTRLETSFNIFSKQGAKFLILELIIVFLGVYLAFLFQSYNENQKVASEKDKVMVGLKEDLEYFRVFFPGFISTTENHIAEWDGLIAEGKYIDFSSWRFIQPQYDYKVVEYALNADAEVIDFELNSALAQLYLELEKLQQAEALITETASRYRAIPADAERTTQIQLEHQNNLLNLKRMRNRTQDRVNIMKRVVSLATENLDTINATFSMQKRKEIELLLIERRLASISDQEKAFFMKVLQQYFPHLSEEEIRGAMNF